MPLPSIDSDEAKKGAAAFTPGLRPFIIAALFLYILYLSLTPVRNMDIWWILKTGEITCQLGHLPYTDDFSYTAGGRPLMHIQWLSSVLLYLLYHQGGMGLLFVFRSLAALSLFAIIFTLAIRKNGGSIGAAALAALWLVQATGIFRCFEIRAYLFSFILMALTCLILNEASSGKKKWLLYTLVPITFLWANLHGMYIMSLILQFFFLIEMLLRALAERYAPSSPWQRELLKLEGTGGAATAKGEALLEVKRRTLCLVLSIAAAAINPYGVRMLLLPFANQDNHFIRNTYEFYAPDYWGKDIWFTITAAALLILSLFYYRKLRLSDYFILIAFTYLGFKWTRNVALYSFMALPSAAVILAAWGDMVKQSVWVKRKGESQERFLIAHALTKKLIASLLVIVTAAVFYISFSRIDYHHLSLEWEAFPVAGVQFLKNNRIQGNMLHPYGWGGYLLFHLYPEYRVMVDGRGMIAYSEEVFMDNLYAFREAKDWQLVLQKYDISFILYDKTFVKFFGKHMPEYLKNSPDWTLIFEDGMEMIFLRNGEKNRDMREKFKAGGLIIPVTPMRLNQQALDAINREGDLKKSEELLKLAVKMHSRYIPGYKNLAYICLQRNDSPGALRYYGKILRFYPNDAEVLANMGIVYEKMGNSKKARHCYSKALKLEPGNAGLRKKLGL